MALARNAALIPVHRCQELARLTPDIGVGRTSYLRVMTGLQDCLNHVTGAGAPGPAQVRRPAAPVHRGRSRAAPSSCPSSTCSSATKTTWCGLPAAPARGLRGEWPANPPPASPGFAGPAACAAASWYRVVSASASALSATPAAVSLLTPTAS